MSSGKKSKATAKDQNLFKFLDGVENAKPSHPQESLTLPLQPPIETPLAYRLDTIHGHYLRSKANYTESMKQLQAQFKQAAPRGHHAAADAEQLLKEKSSRHVVHEMLKAIKTVNDWRANASSAGSDFIAAVRTVMASGNAPPLLSQYHVFELIKTLPEHGSVHLAVEASTLLDDLHRLFPITKIEKEQLHCTSGVWAPVDAMRNVVKDAPKNIQNEWILIKSWIEALQKVADLHAGREVHDVDSHTMLARALLAARAVQVMERDAHDRITLYTSKGGSRASDKVKALLTESMFWRSCIDSGHKSSEELKSVVVLLVQTIETCGQLLYPEHGGVLGGEEIDTTTTTANTTTRQPRLVVSKEEQVMLNKKRRDVLAVLPIYQVSQIASQWLRLAMKLLGAAEEYGHFEKLSNRNSGSNYRVEMDNRIAEMINDAKTNHKDRCIIHALLMALQPQPIDVIRFVAHGVYSRFAHRSSDVLQFPRMHAVYERVVMQTGETPSSMDVPLEDIFHYMAEYGVHDLQKFVSIPALLDQLHHLMLALSYKETRSLVGTREREGMTKHLDTLLTKLEETEAAWDRPTRSLFKGTKSLWGKLVV